MIHSKYYDFKKKLYEYQLKTGRSLIAEACEKTTKTQAEIYTVNARWIRMDSKLVGSNIVKCTRLQLIISCLQEFYKSLDEKSKEKLLKEDRNVLEELIRKKAYQIVYMLTEVQKEEYLKKFGNILSRIEEIYKDKDGNISGDIKKEKYEMIVRLLNEQYDNKGDRIELKAESEFELKYKPINQ